MSKSDQATHVVVKGRVQGVGFRFFALAAAEAQNLKGWVRNRPDGDVECEAEGPRTLKNFLDLLRKGPPLAHVDVLDVIWRPASGQFPDFSDPIRRIISGL